MVYTQSDAQNGHIQDRKDMEAEVQGSGRKDIKSTNALFQQTDIALSSLQHGELEGLPFGPDSISSDLLPESNTYCEF